MKPHWQNIEPSPYALLLESQDWKEKRNHIVNRDGNQCQKCNNNNYISDSELTLHLSLQTRISEGKGNFIIFEEDEEFFARKIECTKEYFKSNFQKQPNLCLLNNSRYLVAVFQVDLSIEKNGFFFKELVKKEHFRWVFKSTVELSKTLIKYHDLFDWKMTKYLNVHHKFYQKGNMPWEYDDDALITLCGPCHQKTHEEETIYLYNENGKKIILTPCDRCDGTGVKPEYHYVENGICFKCRGSRFIEDLI